MSQTINGKHLANRPMTRSPRPRPRRPRRTGLLLGALAAVVAAIIAIPALVALAAPKLTMTVAPAAEQAKGIEVNGATAYANDATYTVTIEAPSGVKLDTTNATTVSGTADDSTVAWADNSSWSQNGDDDQAHSYTRNVTVTGGTLNQIVVNASFWNSDGSTDTDELRSDERITVDKNVPVVSIKMNQDTIGNDSSTDYFNKEDSDLTATVTVIDSTFDSGQTAVTNAENQTLTPQDGWTPNGSDKWSATFDVSSTTSFTVSAQDKLNHSATVKYGQEESTTDSSGNPLTGSQYSIDEGTLAIDVTYNGAELVSSNSYNSEQVAVAIRVSGSHIGTTSISVNGNAETIGSGSGDWKEADGEDGSKVFTKTFSDQKAYALGVIACKDYDPDNSSKKGMTYNQTFTIDRTEPTATVSFNPETTTHHNADGADLYDANRTATITVNDALGLDESLIKVYTADGVQVEGLAWTRSDDDTSSTTTYTFQDGGPYKLTLAGTDKAGNDLQVTGASTTDFYVDATDPDISIDLGEPAVKDSIYYNNPVIPTIVIADANFDASSTKVTVNEKEITDLQWSEDDKGGIVELPECVDDRTYKIEVTTADRAGHPATETTSFVIDRTPPVVNLAVNGATNADGSFYGEPCTVTVEVTDENFDPDRVKLSGIEGSNEGVAQWESNGDSHVATFTFSSDGAYEVKADVTDRANNSVAQKTTGKFTIDETAPVLSVKFEDDDSAVDSNEDTDYYSAARTAIITVDELNFDPECVTITGNGIKDEGGWQSGEGNTHTLKVTFPESSSPYEMTVHAKDKAGNDSVESAGSTESYTYDSGTFVVDTTDPEVSIQLNKAQVQEVGGVGYFAEAPTATVTVKDANFKSADSNIVSSGTWSGTWAEGDTDDSGITTWTTTVSFAEGTNQSLSVTAADWAAHKTETAYGTSTTDSEGKELTQGTFTVDLTAPEVTSASVDRNPVNNYGDNYYFNAATRLTVNVSDNIGLDSLTMTDTDDGTYVLGNQIEAGAKTGTVTIGFADGHDFDRAVTVRTTDLAHNYRYWSISPTGEVKAVNEADLTNEPVFDGTYPESMLQDTVAPVVSLSGVEAGAYYNSPQSVLLSVDELNMPILRTYEPDQVVLTVTQVAGNASGATSTWTRPLSQLAGTGGINYQLTEPFSADGHYTVSAQVTDPARNQDSAQIGEFTIDQTAPTVEVSFDNNDVLNGRYYKAGRTATITVTEHNFDPSLVSIDTNGAVGSWSNNGDTHTIQVSFSTDGVYNLSVSGTDRAGNAMAPYQADEFVVDLTAPTVTISGVEDSTAYKGVVEPTISFADEANFDPNGTTYTLTGTKNGTVTYDASTSAEAQGSTVSYADFAREADVDDIYTLTAHLSDLAGNEADATVTFSVNRFGSTFRVVDAGSYEENDGYLTERRDVVIEEINVSGVASESHDVTVTEGTTVSDLTLNDTAQDTGYTIEAGTSTGADSNGWSVYTYRVAAGNFVNDGRYHVAVESVDRADNTNTSSSYYDRSSGEVAAAEVDFILDTTDPVITNLNVQSGQTYDSSAYQGSFTVVENIGLRDVEVLVDGEKVEATDDGYGNYTFEVNAASFTPRDLQITATDLAGRRGTADAEGFHVTTDILELHLPWVIAGAIVVVAAAAGAFYVLVYKPRKDQDQGNNTDAAA